MPRGKILNINAHYFSPPIIPYRRIAYVLRLLPTTFLQLGIYEVSRLLSSSYKLVFLMRVVGLSASNAGKFSALASSVLSSLDRWPGGFLCDKVHIPVLSRKRGKKMTWHLVGTILTAVSIPLFFSDCLVCSSEPSQLQLTLYYVSISMLLALSFNLKNIAHLSLVPFIAKDQSEAIKLKCFEVGGRNIAYT